MKPNFDTSKIANGNRPFNLNPAPLSVQATYAIGIFLVALAAGNFLASLWAGVTFGLTQFSAVFVAALCLLALGVLFCAVAQGCNALFSILQVLAYQGKRP